ncbi:HNH endonuclease signature motif containing protein [Calidifontibacter terrae]
MLAIARELQDARPDTCERVEDAVFDTGIHTRTKVEAARAVRGLVTRFEAAAARQTARKTTAQQQGVWLDPHPTPGLSQLSVVLGSERAGSLMAAINSRADELHRSADDDRTLGQHRTDALFDLAMHNVDLIAHFDLLVPVQTGDAGGSGGSGSNREGPSGPARSAGPTGVGEPTGDQSAQTPGPAGGIGGSGQPSEPARYLGRSAPEMAASAGRRLTTTEIHALVTRGATLTFTASGEAIDAAAVLDMVGNLARDRAAQRADDSMTTGRHGVSSDHLPRRRDSHGVRVTATVYRFDPESGRLVDGLGESSAYRPPPAVRQQVMARDRTCRHPGCNRPARFTDLDHITPWPRGATSADNLHCLCRRHHRAKQAGWKVASDAAGIEARVSPTGRSYRTQPGMLDALELVSR